MLRNSTKIYYAKVGKINLVKKVKTLPESRLVKLGQYTNEKDKKLCIGAFLLLRKALLRNFKFVKPYDFQYDINGKPIIKDHKIEISISHSGDYVAVALSSKPVGVDIQETRDVDLDARKLVFDEADEKLFNNSTDKKDTFYSIWVSKEAKFKMDQTPFKNAHLNDAKIFTFDNYKIGVSCQTKNIKIKKIRI